MSRSSRLLLGDIAECCARISAYTAGMDRQAFSADGKTVDAVLRNLANLGEAAKALPEETRRAAPEIEWRKIAGLRDVLVHAYFSVDLDIVWDVVESKVPDLHHAVARLLDDPAIT